LNLPPFFNVQFLDDDGTPLSGGFLHTYVSGTTTPQTTYEDQAGVATNTNPIVLDAAGFCNLWLDPVLEYDFLLERSDSTTVRVYEDVSGASTAGDTVTSINSLTGEVTLNSEDVPFATGTVTSWFDETDVQAALDALITRANAMPAASVTIADAGNLITATTVEGALQELAGLTTIPSQTGNSGEFLTTNGTVLSWGMVPASSVPIVDAGGLLTATNVEAALQELAAVTGLPSQTGNSGKSLTTNGATASWAFIVASAVPIVDAGGLITATNVETAFAELATDADALTADFTANGKQTSGTWTPGISFGGGSTGITYTSQSGEWRLVGDLLFVQGAIVLSNKGSSTGSAAITGLPQTSNGSSVINIIGAALTGLTGGLYALVQGGTTTVTLRQSAATGSDVGVTDAEFTNTTTVLFAGSFLVS
jgi:hypothetical protein